MNSTDKFADPGMNSVEFAVTSTATTMFWFGRSGLPETIRASMRAEPLGSGVGLTDGVGEIDGEMLGVGEIDGVGEIEALGVGLIDGEGEGVGVSLGEIDGVGEIDTVGEIDGDTVGVVEVGETEGDGEGVALIDGVGEMEAVGEIDAEGEMLGLTVGEIDGVGETVGEGVGVKKPPGHKSSVAEESNVTGITTLFLPKRSTPSMFSVTRMSAGWLGAAITVKSALKRIGVRLVLVLAPMRAICLRAKGYTGS